MDHHSFTEVHRIGIAGLVFIGGEGWGKTRRKTDLKTFNQTVGLD
jgi:hypothetical protein